MDNIKVSIIMPVYNSDEYLEETISSVLKQDFEEFELILVDDGSTDRSGIICDKYASNNKVKVIHKINGGICSARNAGIKIANGEYIGFCDNDDLFLPGLIKDNYNLAKQYDADVVRFFRIHRIVDNGRIIKENHIINKQFLVLHREEFIQNYDYIRKSSSGIWTGLYKNKIIKEENIYFNEKLKFGHEDALFNILFYEFTNTIVVNPKEYYIWLQRGEHSTSRKFDINQIYSIDKCLEKEIDVISKMKLKSKHPGAWEEILAHTYIHDYLYTLINKNCNFSYRQKISLLKTIRKKAVFSDKDKKNAMKNLKKKDIKAYIVYKLFKMKLFSILYFLDYIMLSSVS